MEGLVSPQLYSIPRPTFYSIKSDIHELCEPVHRDLNENRNTSTTAQNELVSYRYLRHKRMSRNVDDSF